MAWKDSALKQNSSKNLINKSILTDITSTLFGTFFMYSHKGVKAWAKEAENTSLEKVEAETLKSAVGGPFSKAKIWGTYVS